MPYIIQVNAETGEFDNDCEWCWTGYVSHDQLPIIKEEDIVNNLGSELRKVKLHIKIPGHVAFITNDERVIEELNKTNRQGMRRHKLDLRTRKAKAREYREMEKERLQDLKLKRNLGKLSREDQRGLVDIEKIKPTREVIKDDGKQRIR